MLEVLKKTINPENINKILSIFLLKSGLILTAIFFPFMRILNLQLKYCIFILLLINFLLCVFFTKKIKINYFSFLVLIFLLILSLSVQNFKFFFYFILFYSAFNIVKKNNDVYLFLKLSTLSIFALSLLIVLSFAGIFNFFYFHHYSSGLIRLWGFTEKSNPNNFALLFTLIFPFIGYFYRKVNFKKIIFIFFIFFAIILTQSKAAILPIVLILPFVVFDYRVLKKRIARVYLIMFIFILILIPVIKKSKFTKRLALMEKGYRNLIWKASFELFLSNPLGYYNKDYKQLIYKKITTDYGEYIDKPKNTHNLPLFVLLQTGIIGFFVFSFFIFYIFYRSVVLIKHDDIFLHFTLSFFVFFFFNLLHLAISWFYFWVFLGVWSSVKPELEAIERSKE